MSLRDSHSWQRTHREQRSFDYGNRRLPRRNLKFDFGTGCSVSNGLMGGRGWRASARNPEASFAPLSPAPATRSIKARVECDRGIGPCSMDIHVRRMTMRATYQGSCLFLWPSSGPSCGFETMANGTASGPIGFTKRQAPFDTAAKRVQFCLSLDLVHP